MSSSATKYPTRPDIKGDAERVIRVLQNGGVALAPASIGYGAITSSPRKIEEIFIAKGRAPTKRHAMAGSYAVHRELHIMAPRDQEIVDHLVHDLDVPVAVIAKFNDKHPMFSNLDDVTMEALSVNGTLAILINGGRFQDELARLGLAADVPILGSSANITGTGMSTQAGMSYHLLGESCRSHYILVPYAVAYTGAQVQSSASRIFPRRFYPSATTLWTMAWPNTATTSVARRVSAPADGPYGSGS